MRPLYQRSICLLVAGCLWTSMSIAAVAQQEIDNPVYRNWQDFPVGSQVTYRSVTTVGEDVSKQEYTLTLKSKDKNKIVIERQLTAFLPDGVQQIFPAMTSQNQRKFRLPKGVDPPNPDKPNGVTEQGEEELEWLGRKLKTKWFKAKMRVEAGEMFTHSWSSSAIPGGLVKAVNETPATKSVNTVELIELKIPGEE